MPVLTCVKDGDSGYKWGEQGVCFIGPGSRERAAEVGRAIAAQENKSMDNVEKAETSIKQKVLGLIEQFKHNILHSEPPFEDTGSPVIEPSLDPSLTNTRKNGNPVMKALDKEKRLITGVVLEPEIVDAHGDIISELDIEETAFRFMELHQTIGKQHSEKAKAVPVESFITREDTTIGDQLVVKGTWVMTVKVLDDKLWEDAKNGEFTGFSIGGVAKTEDLQ